MRTSLTVSLSLMVTVTFAFAVSLAEASASSTHVVRFEASTGPVTVISRQPEVLPNAADYQVKIGDLDSNGDGLLSRREIPPEHALSSEFHLVDRNRNGYITATELANWR